MGATIWKFPLAFSPSQTVELPLGATVLAVQAQYDSPCLWVQVEPEAPMVRRVIHCCGTGHEVPAIARGHHIGTTQHSAGDLVLHWFEEGPR